MKKHTYTTKNNKLFTLTPITQWEVNGTLNSGKTFSLGLFNSLEDATYFIESLHNTIEAIFEPEVKKKLRIMTNEKHTSDSHEARQTVINWLKKYK